MFPVDASDMSCAAEGRAYVLSQVKIVAHAIRSENKGGFHD